MMRHKINRNLFLPCCCLLLSVFLKGALSSSSVESSTVIRSSHLHTVSANHTSIPSASPQSITSSTKTTIQTETKVHPSSSKKSSLASTTVTVIPSHYTQKTTETSVPTSHPTGTMSHYTLKTTETSVPIPHPTATHSTLAKSTSTKMSVSSAKQPSSTVKPQPVIIVKYKCGANCENLKKRIWAAGFFAVLFAVVTLILVVLLCRQYRMARDENDPAMARLI